MPFWCECLYRSSNWSYRAPWILGSLYMEIISDSGKNPDFKCHPFCMKPCIAEKKLCKRLNLSWSVKVKPQLVPTGKWCFLMHLKLSRLIQLRFYNILLPHCRAKPFFSNSKKCHFKLSLVNVPPMSFYCGILQKWEQATFNDWANTNWLKIATIIPNGKGWSCTVSHTREQMGKLKLSSMDGLWD